MAEKTVRGIEFGWGAAEETVEIHNRQFIAGGCMMQIGSISSVGGVDATTPVAPVSSGHSTGTHGAAPKQTEQPQGNLSSVDQALAAVYTTSVAGHHYEGAVQQTNGQYLVSVADPPMPPLTGIGSSIQSAEDNMTLILDERA
jgi:hypothetical protein